MATSGLQSSVASGLNAVLGELQGGFAATTLAANAFIEVLEQLGGIFTKFVSNFSPAAVTLFTRAMSDFQAVIGQQMVPALRAVTQAVRFFADTADGLFGLLGPGVQRLGAAVVPVFQTLGKLFNTVMGVLADLLVPILGQVADLFTGLVAGIEPLVGALGQLVKVAGTLLPYLLAGLVPATLALVPLLKAVGELLGRFVAAALVPLQVVLAAASAVVKAFVAVLGVIGNVLAVPVRLITQVFAALAPVTTALGGALTDVIGLLGDVATGLGELASAVAGLVGDALGGALKVLTDVIRGVVGAAVTAVNVFRAMIAALRQFLGIQGPEFQQGSAFGRSYQQASTTSATDLLKRLDERAFGLGSQGKDEPLKPVPGLLNTMIGKLEEVKNAVLNLPAATADYARTKAVADGANTAIQARNVLRSLIPVVGNS